MEKAKIVVVVDGGVVHGVYVPGTTQGYEVILADWDDQAQNEPDWVRPWPAEPHSALDPLIAARVFNAGGESAPPSHAGDEWALRSAE